MLGKNQHARFMKQLYVLTAFVLAFSCRVLACGYDFVGDCSTGIGLRINNTPDSFAIATCPSGIRMDGLDVGAIQTLAIIRGRAITWESCQNNVTGTSLYYRVYKAGGFGGLWSKFDLGEEYNTLAGPYTTRYFGKNVNIDLTTGLNVGTDYVLEVYYLAQVDTIGNDFIPETTLAQHNNGHNYLLHFRYGGLAAPPFTVVKTLEQPDRCHGDSNGSVGVSVYGDHAGLVYHWSNAPFNNFWEEFNLPAGDYTVTVTGSTYSQTQSFTISQPEPLSVGYPLIQPVGCTSNTGAATATGNGGTAPYQYQWDNGETTQTAQFNTGGVHGLTITDQNSCKGVFSVTIPVQGPVTTQQTVVLCPDHTFQVGGMTFSAAGVYTVHIPGINACDTILTLTILNADPSAALVGLPDSTSVTCQTPSLYLCPAPALHTTFQWYQNNVLVSSDTCLLVNFSGNYKVIATTTQSSIACQVEKKIKVTDHQTPPDGIAWAKIKQSCSNAPITHVVFHSMTNAQNPQYQWKLNGQLLSTADSCVIDTITTNIINGTTIFQLIVTDLWGCKKQIMPQVQVTQSAILIIKALSTPATGMSHANGTASAFVISGTPPYVFQWSNGMTTDTIEGLLPGTYCVTVTDASQCQSSTCTNVSVANQTNSPAAGRLILHPNLVTGGQITTIQLPDSETGASVAVRLIGCDGRILSSDRHAVDNGTVQVQIPANSPKGVVWVQLIGEKGFFVGSIHLQ
jgi:hypothetical protein